MATRCPFLQLIFSSLYSAFEASGVTTILKCRTSAFVPFKVACFPVCFPGRCVGVSSFKQIKNYCTMAPVIDSGQRPLQNAMRLVRVAIQLDTGNRHKVELSVFLSFELV